MTTYRYQAIEAGGSSVEGVIEAADRKSAIQLLGKRGLFPSVLEAGASNGAGATPAVSAVVLPVQNAGRSEWRLGNRIKRKEITAFTREMGVLLDMFVGIFVICIIVNHINRAFSSLDTRQLANLKE